MWPDLFGPGWQLQFLMALVLMAFLLGVIGLLWLAAGHTSPVIPDEMLTAYRRYEIGDLTRQELERVRGAAAARTDRREDQARVKPRVPARVGWRDLASQLHRSSIRRSFHALYDSDHASTNRVTSR